MALPAGRETMQRLIEHEPVVRLAGFLGVLTLLAVAEAVFPRRPRLAGRSARWPSNLGIVALDALIVRVLFPGAAIGIALAMEGRGLLAMLGGGWVFTVALGVVLLDLTIYLQHRLFHAVPALWRLHRMHHADLDFDVTTGLRFHPGEIVLSLLIKMAVVAVCGIPPLAVLLFEVLLNATSLFTHANLRLPLRLDALVRLVLVTPDMHRVHHSVVRAETDSNFGFNLAVWDRLFGTYRAEPAAGHDAMTIGLPIFRDRAELRLDRLLTQPFRNDVPVRPPDRGAGERDG